MVQFIESTISLGILIIVLGLLIGAIFLKSRKNYRQHGIVMLSAVVLHIISIFTVMIPSFTAFFGMPSSVNFADTLIIVTLVHVSAGLLAALLGAWLVSSWHLQANLQTCFKKKRIMDVTISLWLLAIALGVFLYLAIIQII
jgi:uncharacterized membrane protein YozB (DUF420 family)